MPLMTIGEARKILGEDGGDLSDRELQYTIVILEDLARETIRAIMRGEFSTPNDESKELN